MSIQNICIIILGSISLLALFDLRKKTKELDGLKCKFERQPLDANELPTEEKSTLALQINELRKQQKIENILLFIIILAVIFLIILTSKIYVKTYNVQDYSDGIYKLFEYTK